MTHVPAPGALSTADSSKIATIRAELPAVEQVVYLNSGTCGPLPVRSHAALTTAAEAELSQGRIDLATFARKTMLMDATRTQIAALLHCDPLEVALTHNTTEGINIGLLGLDWQPGDEIVTGTTEHEGVLNPVALLRHRFGVTVHLTDIGLPQADPVRELQRVLTPRTKAVALSHVSWATGMMLPLRALADVAHAAGALMICDAAQACGMVPAHVYDLGVDVYACSGQKWLCGPDGTGAVFIRQDRWETIHQTYMGYPGLKARMNRTDAVFTPGDGARRYEALALYGPAVNAWNTTLAWLADEVGWEWVFQRIQSLGRYCYNVLAHIPGVQVYTPYEAMAGLVHFSVDGMAAPQIAEQLRTQGILIRNTPEPELCRVSTGFYNTEAELDRLAAAIQAMIS